MLIDLANTINGAQQALHAIHFMSSGDNFGDLHETMGEYYSTMQVHYDDVVELAIQCNDTTPLVSVGQIEQESFGIREAFSLAQQLIEICLSKAMACYTAHSGSNIDDVSVQNYLQGFIEYWSKESRYKIKQRLTNIDRVMVIKSNVVKSAQSYQESLGALIKEDPKFLAVAQEKLSAKGVDATKLSQEEIVPLLVDNGLNLWDLVE